MATKRQGLHNQWKLRMSVSCSDEPGDIDTYQGRIRPKWPPEASCGRSARTSGFEGPKWERCGNNFENMIQRESSYLILDFGDNFLLLRTPITRHLAFLNLTCRNKNYHKLWQYIRVSGFCWFDVALALLAPSLLSVNPPLRIVNTPSTHCWCILYTFGSGQTHRSD